MRVIAGIYRSRKLRTLRGLALRPSSDRLRETLFNVLGARDRRRGVRGLVRGFGRGRDRSAQPRRAARYFRRESPLPERLCFAPTLNRSAFRWPDLARLCEKTFGGAAEILARDACAAIERLAARGTKADFVFADPPYADSAAYEDVLELLGESQLLAPGSRLILEHERRRELPAIAGQLERVRVLEQGTAALSFYHVARAA